MIEEFEITNIMKQGRMFFVETNVGQGWGFGMIKTENPKDTDNRGLVVSMGYNTKNKEVVEFLENSPMKKTIIIRKEILEKFHIVLTTKDDKKETDDDLSAEDKVA